MASKYGVYNASLTGNWASLGAAFANLSVRFPQAMESALHEEGEFYRRKMVEGIREQAPGGQTFKPLSEVTIALRKLMGFGGTKALIRSGELRNHIVSVPGKGFVFVGILYTARGEDGRNLAEIGRINEYGGTIRTSISRDRMRLIAAALRKTKGRSSSKGGSGGLGMMHIPARPFIRPVIAEYGQRRGAERYMARVARKVGGLLGVINHPDLGGFGAERLPERLSGGRAGGFAAGLRGMRKGTAKGGRRRGPFQFKKALAKGFSRAGRGGVRMKKNPRTARAPKIIRPRLPKPKAPRQAKASAASRKAAGGSAKAPKAPKAPKTPAVKVRAPKGGVAGPGWFQRGRANIAKQQAAHAKKLAAGRERMQRLAARAAEKAQKQAERAEKQALKDYLRANPQHNAHVKHRQMRLNLGHKV